MDKLTMSNIGEVRVGNVMKLTLYTTRQCRCFGTCETIGVRNAHAITKEFLL